VKTLASFNLMFLYCVFAEEDNISAFPLLARLTLCHVYSSNVARNVKLPHRRFVVLVRRCVQPVTRGIKALSTSFFAEPLCFANSV
jgi:hypothetical protein